MTNFAAKFAGIATLALAALPALALTTAAHATPAPVTIKVSDLNLGSQAGRDAFDARVRKAERQMCQDAGALSGFESCADAVRTEAREKLAQYLQGRSPQTELAAGR
jgi:UrcA family protein